MTAASFKLVREIGPAIKMPEAKRPHGAAASAIKPAHLIIANGVPKGFRLINTPSTSANKSGLLSWPAIALKRLADGF